MPPIFWPIECRHDGIIGSGFQAKTQLDAIRAVRPHQDCACLERNEEKRNKFAEDNSVIAVNTAEEAVRNAQIVVTATNSKDPVLEERWISPGALVNAMGSNIPNRVLPSGLLRLADSW